MRYPTAKLSEVAPYKPLKIGHGDAEEVVLQLTLDSIESNTGELLYRNYQPVLSAGSSTHWFDERYVLYSKLRPYLNKVYLPSEKGLGTTELVPMLPDTERLDRKYLAYYLRSKTFVEWVSVQTAGAKMPRVSMKVFWNHQIPLPPLKTQKQIAAILEKADQLRLDCQKMEQELNNLAQSVYVDMFGDPVRNPKGFPVKALPDLADIQIGPFGTQLHKEDYVKGGVPLINPTHIKEGKVCPDWTLTVAEEKYRKLPQYHLRMGDIVMGRRGEMGRTAIIDESTAGYFCGTGSLFIRPKVKKIDVSYLNAVISSPSMINWLESQSHGATMPNLNKGIMGKIHIPIPTEKVQSNYQKVKSGLLAKQRLQNEEHRQYEYLFESLMQKAFNGELSIKNKAA